MSATTERRVSDLEKRVFVDTEGQPEGVFICVTDCTREGAGRRLPVFGWKYQDTVIMRNENETDEQLQKRAIETVKPLLTHKLAVPVFHPISKEN